MDEQKIWFLVINSLGGFAVIASYVAGMVSHPNTEQLTWGRITPALKSVYLVSMPLAAVGYLFFLYFILFQLDAGTARIWGFDGFLVLDIIFAVILVFSAFWMPLTYKLIETQWRGWWVYIRIVLFFVALGSLALLCALLMISQREPAWSYWLAVSGAVVFFVQAGIIDAFVWTAMFPYK
ncbi:MAG: hypothetical protein JW901_04755 [Dehalococcoidia bacterium]|nr:hypothetical protein [Dehalococcoidia bacterium]